jgi:hypothetical protein
MRYHFPKSLSCRVFSGKKNSKKNDLNQGNSKKKACHFGGCYNYNVDFIIRVEHFFFTVSGQNNNIFLLAQDPESSYSD